MRSINFRFLAWIVVGVATFGAAVWGLREIQVRRNAGEFLEMARRAKSDNNLERAVRNYASYLRLVPNDAVSLAEYGTLLAEMGRVGHAFGFLERAVQLAPDSPEARRRLVEVLIGMNRHRDAGEHLEKYLLPESPEDGELRTLLGQCQESLGRPKEAAQSYQDAIRFDPHSLDSYARLAHLLGREGRHQDAADWMEKLVAGNPGTARAHVLRGQYRKACGRWEDAAKDADEALRHAPDDGDALLLAAQCALARGNLDAARTHADRGRTLYPRHREYYAVIADVETRRGRRDEAIVTLRRGVDETAGDHELLSNLANLYLDARRITEAQQVVSRFHDLSSSKQVAAYLLARLEYEQGHWLAASRILEQVRPELVTSPSLLKQADYWLGNCYAQLGKADLQLAAHRRAVAADPLWTRARAGVVSALVSLKRVDEALEESREMMKLRDAPPDGLLVVARLLILNNLGASSGDRNWAEVETVLDQAARALPKSSLVSCLRAEALVGQNRLADAERVLKEACDKDPKRPELWVAIAALARRQRHWDSAETILGEAERHLGNHPELRLARAQLLVVRRGKQASEPLRKLAASPSGESAADVLRLQWGLAQLALGIGDYRLAKELADQLSEKDPNNLQLRLLQFDLALCAEDDSGLERILSEIHRIEGPGPLWHYGRAVWLRLSGKKNGSEQLTEALEHLNQVRAARPSWSRIPLLAGEICDRQGRDELAAQHYLQAFELGERTPFVVRRAVQLLYQQQRYAEVDRVIRQVEEQQTLFTGDLGRMAAEVSLRLDDFDRALEMARQVAANSKEYRDHVWLGQLLGLLGTRAQAEPRAQVEQTEEDSRTMLAEAEREFRKAIELAPAATDAWVAYIHFLGRTGQSQSAERAIAEAAQRMTGKQAALALAQAWEAMGKIEEAAKRYQAAVAASSDDPRVLRKAAEFFLRTGKASEAEFQLERLIRGPLQVGEQDRIWARRSLALAFVERGGYQNLQRARALVDENLTAPGATMPDRRAHAVVLASYPSREQRRESVRAWEAIIKEQPNLAPEDRFILARLYAGLGDRTNSARQMRTLLASHGREPRYVAAYVRDLLSNKEISEAELWLKRLPQLAPAAFTTASLQSQADLLRGKPEASVKVLREYLDRQDARPPARAARLALVAAQLEDLAGQAMNAKQEAAAKHLYREAETAFRQYAELEPQQTLRLAGFLARTGKQAESIQLIEKHVGQAAPELVAETVSGLLSGGRFSPELLQRIEALLVSAVNKHGRPSLLLSVMAELHVHQGLHAQAEAIYREILQKNKADLVATNNLAMLLALRRTELDEAERLAQRAIGLGGPVAAILDTWATVLLAQGRVQEAIAQIDKAIDENRDAAFFFHRALALLQNGDRPGADRALSEARKLGLRAEQLHPLERPAYLDLMKRG